VTEGPLPTDVLAVIDDAPSRPNRNGHPISTAFRFQSWSEVSHAKADGTRPSAIVHDMNAVDHDRRASTAPVPWRSLISRPDRAARYLPVATGSSGSKSGISCQIESELIHVIGAKPRGPLVPWLRGKMPPKLGCLAA
jgi:hypothetical protein